ncbi:type I-E CRISPR-associated protein Cas5/CasD [Isoptericola sp. BMS4]|uniref:type I-E CRISPR-associated protein Cas5/CasD n=1 Tax=Isoptericola sp. BMS4 TaxID=2527875 RepID=UPI00142119AC|nr:type I-E CRISPR-associated protein Cas5/CasD [Isoptericola sp. BMS4]
MSTLLLRLAGPMQSWGSGSRFTVRGTDDAPTKSGVVGLLAAARGMRRTDPLESLLDLTFGVRADQPGTVERDFQTARAADGSRSYPLTHRYYLADAVFVAAVEGDDDLIAGLDEALRRPAFPLYLGRRAFPPDGPVTMGTRAGGVWRALHDEEWQAARWYRRRQGSTVDLDLKVDAVALPTDGRDGTARSRTTSVPDEPVSFDPRRREWRLRAVSSATVRVENPDGRSRPGWHDPMALVGGA